MTRDRADVAYRHEFVEPAEASSDVDPGDASDAMSWRSGFFDGAGRAEWLKVLEHQLRFGSDLIMLCGETGVGKSTLLRQLATRLDPALFVVVTCDAAQSASTDLLWLALDRTLKLGSGAEGWDRLKRMARKHSVSGQTLVVLVDHADMLHGESLELLSSILDARLSDVRLLLLVDQVVPPSQGAWNAVASRLADRGQVLRVRSLSVAESVEYLAFRVRQARIPETALDQRLLRQVVTQSNGLPAALDAGLRASLRTDAMTMKAERPAGGRVRPSGVPVDTAKQQGGRETKQARPSRQFSMPKPQTFAIGVLAICLMGFYLVWEKPVPHSSIRTPSPNAQNLPPPVRQGQTAAPTATGEGDTAASSKVPALLKPLVDGKLLPTIGTSSDGPKGLPPPIKPVVKPESEPSAPAPGQPPSEATTVALANPVVAAAPAQPARAAVLEKPVTVEKVMPAERVPAHVAPVEKPVVAAADDEHSRPATKLAAGLPAFKAPGDFTLQLMGMADEAGARAILRQHAGVEGLGFYETRRNGQPWFIVVQGDYPSAQAASAAVKSLPATLQVNKPFPKSVKAVRADLH